MSCIVVIDYTLSNTSYNMFNGRSEVCAEFVLLNDAFSNTDNQIVLGRFECVGGDIVINLAFSNTSDKRVGRTTRRNTNSVAI